MTLKRISALVSIPYEREGISKDHCVSLFDYTGWVSIPYEREGISKDAFLRRHSTNTLKFQFPTNGKAYPKRPHFAPSRAVAPDTPKPNANCAGLFLRKNSSLKSHKPL